MSRTAIYHITHIDNLPSIVADGGLWCDTERRHLLARHVTIAYENLKERRRRKAVTVGAGGVLADYVPFYFCPRSPMLYAIAKGYVTSYRGSQTELIYLVSSVERVIEGEHRWCFTDGHALEHFSNFYSDYHDLDKLDWPVIRNRYWQATLDDPDRKRRKQAEFLVHRFFPLPLVFLWWSPLVYSTVRWCGESMRF